MQLFWHSPLSAKNDISTEGLVAASITSSTVTSGIVTHKAVPTQKANFGDEQPRLEAWPTSLSSSCDLLDSQSVWR